MPRTEIHSTNGTQSSEKGFTLLEVAFVITIFAIMASIVLFRFKDFGSKAAFENLTQDIALRIVGAQKSAISGLLNPNFVGTNNPPSYGVAFRSETGDPETDPAAHEFTYFTDIPVSGFTVGNKRYDDTGPCPGSPTVGNECISVTSTTGGEYIGQVGHIGIDGIGVLDSLVGLTASIVFTRPLPEATMTVCNGAGACSPATSVYITMRSAVDPAIYATIAVQSLGQVRVYNNQDMCSIAGIGC